MLRLNFKLTPFIFQLTDTSYDVLSTPTAPPYAESRNLVRKAGDHVTLKHTNDFEKYIPEGWAENDTFDKLVEKFAKMENVHEDGTETELPEFVEQTSNSSKRKDMPKKSNERIDDDDFNINNLFGT